MTYFFVLGSNPTLSLAELNALFSGDKLELINSEIAFLTIEKKLKPELIKKLGGIIKFGLINTEIKEKEILPEIQKLFIEKIPNIKGKFNFGFSYYGNNRLNLLKTGLEIKNFLKDELISCRLVTSREKNLSSVVVEQNKLTSKGVEIILIDNPHNKSIFLGQTLAVQAFKELSFRDYGRPGRDDFSGMLPPKLAQIMLNLANQDPKNTLLDPFCGSGTIINEALIMGYQNIIGSDISEKAIKDTKTNSQWIINQFQIETSSLNLDIFSSSATTISSEIEPKTISAIITEPYLGPQRGLINRQAIIKELNQLYSKSLQEFSKIIKKNGIIIMIWPIFIDHYNKQNPLNFLNPQLGNLNIIKPLSDNLINHSIKLTNRDTIIYGREGQKVWREIVILKLKQ